MKVKHSKNKILSRIVLERSGYYLVVNQEMHKNTRHNFYFFESQIRSKREMKSLVMDEESLENLKNRRYVNAFLDLLDRDIKSNFNIIEDVSEDLFHRAEKLTEGIEADLDEEFPEDFVLS